MNKRWWLTRSWHGPCGPVLDDWRPAASLVVSPCMIDNAIQSSPAKVVFSQFDYSAHCPKLPWMFWRLPSNKGTQRYQFLNSLTSEKAVPYSFFCAAALVLSSRVYLVAKGFFSSPLLLFQRHAIYDLKAIDTVKRKLVKLNRLPVGPPFLLKHSAHSQKHIGEACQWWPMSSGR